MTVPHLKLKRFVLLVIYTVGRMPFIIVLMASAALA